MKKQLYAFLILIIIFSVNYGYGQIKYGSNNGKYLTVEGTKIYYEEYGEGPSLLLLHRGFGDISGFSEVIPKLSQILPDTDVHNFPRNL